MSTRMLKMCCATTKNLETIFKQGLVTGIFPSKQKKAKLFLFAKNVTNKILRTIFQIIN